MGNYITEGTLVTLWDDEETMIKAPCKVNLLDRTVFDVDMKHREIDSPYSADEIDDNVEQLDCQYVELGEYQIPVIKEESTKYELFEVGFINDDDSVEWSDLPFKLE